MKITTSILTVILFSLCSYAQKENNLHLLIETGHQHVNSKNYAHLGVGIEYSFTKKSSLTFRAKYLQTGISVNNEGSSSGWFSLTLDPSYKLLYKGEILAFPLNYKFETKLFTEKLRFFFNAGPTVNFTLKEKYIITKNIKAYDNPIYLNFNLGLGFGYKINEKNSIYISGESYSFGGGKTEEIGLLSSRIKAEVSFINIGFKHKL